MKRFIAPSAALLLLAVSLAGCIWYPHHGYYGGGGGGYGGGYQHSGYGGGPGPGPGPGGGGGYNHPGY